MAPRKAKETLLSSDGPNQPPLRVPSREPSCASTSSNLPTTPTLQSEDENPDDTVKARKTQDKGNMSDFANNPLEKSSAKEAEKKTAGKRQWTDRALTWDPSVLAHMRLNFENLPEQGYEGFSQWLECMQDDSEARSFYSTVAHSQDELTDWINKAAKLKSKLHRVRDNSDELLLARDEKIIELESEIQALKEECEQLTIGNNRLREQQRGGTVMSSSGESYRRRTVKNLRTKLSGEEREAYRPWKFEIDSTLENEAANFADERAEVRWIIQQLTSPIFGVEESNFNEDRTLTKSGLFNRIESYMDINSIKASARLALEKAKMESGETVNQFYTRLLTKWNEAGTPTDQRTEMLFKKARPGLTRALAPTINLYTISFADLLQSLRNAENNLATVDSSHPRTERFATKSRGASSPSSSSAPHRATSSASSASRSSSSNNSRATPTATKPADWEGTWHNPQSHPNKLTENDKTVLRKEGRCWSCRGSGHIASDKIEGKPVCPNNVLNRKSNNSKKTVIEELSTDPESDASENE